MLFKLQRVWGSFLVRFHTECTATLVHSELKVQRDACGLLILCCSQKWNVDLKIELNSPVKGKQMRLFVVRVFVVREKFC